MVSLSLFAMGCTGAPPPTTQQIGPFATEDLCDKAAEAIRTEMNAPITGQRIQTFARAACFALKNNEASQAPQGMK